MKIRIICSKEELKYEETIRNRFDSVMKELINAGFKGEMQIEKREDE